MPGKRILPVGNLNFILLLDIGPDALQQPYYYSKVNKKLKKCTGHHILYCYILILKHVFSSTVYHLLERET